MSELSQMRQEDVLPLIVRYKSPRHTQDSLHRLCTHATARRHLELFRVNSFVAFCFLTHSLLNLANLPSMDMHR